MSLPLLGAMVVVGIAAIVLAVHLTGGSRAARLADQAHARDRFREDFPDEKVEDVVLTEEHRAAFLPLAGGGMGIVHGFGDRFFTRIVDPEDILAIEASGPVLRIRLNEFSWKGGEFRFSDAATAARVRAALESRATAGAH